MNDNDNLLGVLKSIFRWKKQILWLCILAGIGSICISLILPNYYKASTIFYAASADVAKPTVVGKALKERAYFGVQSDIDKILTIAESGDLKSSLIEKFNLYEHYQIDSTSSKAEFKIREKLNSLYDIINTKYDALELSVEDKDPVFARDLTNAAREEINLIAKRLTKQTQLKQIKGLKKALQKKESEIDILGDSLQVLREFYGIYNTNSQSESLGEQLAETEADYLMTTTKLESLKSNPAIRKDTIAYIRATAKAYEEKLKSTKQMIKRFNSGVSQFSAVDITLKTTVGQFGADQERLRQLQAAYEADTPMLIIVENASTPLVKSRPRRSLLCITSVLIVFIFSALLAVIIDTYQNVNWKEIFNAS